MTRLQEDLIITGAIVILAPTIFVLGCILAIWVICLSPFIIGGLILWWIIDKRMKGGKYE